MELSNAFPREFPGALPGPSRKLYSVDGRGSPLARATVTLSGLARHQKCFSCLMITAVKGTDLRNGTPYRMNLAPLPPFMTCTAPWARGGFAKLEKTP